MAGIDEADPWLRGAALLVVVLMGALVAFEVCLAAGVPWGHASYGGQYEVLPLELRVASGVAALVWSAFAVVVAWRSGLVSALPVSPGWLGIVVWVLVGILVLAVVMNAITPSVVERAIWLPMSTLMLIGTVVVAIRA